MTTFWSFVIWACLIGVPVFYIRLRMAATALRKAKAAHTDGNEGEAQRQFARGMRLTRPFGRMVGAPR